LRLSYVIISFNRRERLLQTLAVLQSVTPLAHDEWDIWVVDNASGDGSADAVAEAFPQVNLIRNASNQGMFARNHAFTRCRGQYIISLDDDSYPQDARSVAEMLVHMDERPKTGALVARVMLSDGASTEAPALPAVLMGGASCLRKSVLDKIGGFRQEFFRQAEEYDLSFRIWQAGFTVERREDIIFRHEKTILDDGPSMVSSGRNSELVRSMDLRNNLIIAQRFLPDHLRPIYWDDWRLRYEALARHFGHNRAAVKALWSGRAWAVREAFNGSRLPLDERALENIFAIRHQAKLIGDWSRRNSVWRVAIADFGKNIWATYNACHASGLQLRCVVDENPAFSELKYRGLPILLAADAFNGGGIDGVVVANINPAQVEQRAKTISKLFKGPVLKLWQPPRLAAQARATAA
jgi:GT2 family glycosyltransferase